MSHETCIVISRLLKRNGFGLGIHEDSGESVFFHREGLLDPDRFEELRPGIVLCGYIIQTNKGPQLHCAH